MNRANHKLKYQIESEEIIKELFNTTLGKTCWDDYWSLSTQEEWTFPRRETDW